MNQNEGFVVGRKPMGTISYMGGVPAVLENFCWSFAQLIQFNCEFVETQTEYIHYDRARFSDHAPARNSLVRDFLGDWLLQLDTDHQFEPNLLKRILLVHYETGAQVISGLYRFKNEPFSPVSYINDENGKSSPIVEIPDEVDIIEINASGAGCLFVTREVYDKVRQHFNCEPFDRIGGHSEDHSFFKRCCEIGIKCYLATKIEAYHLQVFPITKEYTKINNINSKQVKVKGFNNG